MIFRDLFLASFAIVANVTIHDSYSIEGSGGGGSNVGVINYFLDDNRIITPIRVIFYDVYYLSDEVVGR